MLFMTLVVPFFVTIAGSERNGGMTINGIVFIATLWGIGPIGSSDIQFHVFLSYDIIPTFLLSVPNIIFSGQIVRYLMGKTSHQRTLIFGILGFLFPFIITINLMIAILLHGYLAYAGPLPFQIIIGLILMKYLEPPTEILWESGKAHEEQRNE
ncbi:MAG: hypothetical protein PVG65_01805 [Candidatus Thorarchaeota archaeon]